MTADSPVPNRTLVGVMPRDMVRALAGGGREQPPQQQSAQRPQQPAVHQQPVHQQPVHQQPVRQQPQQPLRPQQPAPLPQHTAPAVAYGKSTSPVHGQGQQGHAPHQQHVIAQPAPQPPHRPPSTPPPAFEPNRVVSAGGAGPGAAGPSRPAPGPRTMFEPAAANMPQYMPQRPAAPGPRTMLEAPAGGIPDQGTVRSAAPTYDPEPDAMDEAFAANAPGQARTHLGVAIPGIAPLRASMDVGSPPARPKRMLEETMLQPDSLSTPPVTTRAVMPRGAYVLLGSGLVLLVAAVAFALLWQGKKPLEVAVGADPAGRDRLEIVCQDCPDGTIVSLDSISGEIAGQRTELTLPEPLPLGESRVSFGVQRPGAEKPRAVEMTLPPVEYRIRPDTSTLAGDQPRLTLEITAIPGSKVEIARQLVALDPTGRGEIAVDLTGQLNGPATEVVSIEQAIAYVIVPPSGKVYEGQLTVKIGVTPLLLEAPGVDTITDLERFMLAGRTTRGAELWVAGTTISVDGSGRFAQLMSIDSVGETRVTVRATEPGLAPRFASFRLQRVENLENELAARRPKALPLATVARNIADHVGSTVVVTGRIEEAKADGHRSLIILQSEGDCGGRSCLSRLVYGGLKKLERGQTITAIGRLQGTVGAPGAEGAEVPDVDVSLLSL